MQRVNVDITPDGRLLRKSAAKFLGLSPKTLANMQTRGLGPRSIKIAGRRFYWLSDLEDFVASGAAL